MKFTKPKAWRAPLRPPEPPICTVCHLALEVGDTVWLIRPYDYTAGAWLLPQDEGTYYHTYCWEEAA